MKKTVLGILIFFSLTCCQRLKVEDKPLAKGKVTFHPISVSPIQDSSSTFANYDVAYKDTLGVAILNAYDDRIELNIELNCNKPNTYSALHMHYGTPNRPGRHWNPQGTENFCDSLSLGDVWGRKYAGDLGNIHFNELGLGHFFLQTDLWSLGSGKNNDILGNVMVIHLLYEDFSIHCRNNSHNHHHQNPKIGSGIIELD